MIKIEDALHALEFPHTLNYEKRSEIRALITAMQAAIAENHAWHLDYDEAGEGYEGSYMYDVNVNVRFIR